MKILAIETATEACSAALDINDTCQLRFEIAPRKHTELILPMIDDLLNEAAIGINHIDAIAFGQGPGAFTGVRVAIGVIQGLAFAHDTPVIPVSTLAALAQQFVSEHDAVATAIDARMQEVYWGLYKKNQYGLMEKIIDEQVCAATEVTVPESGDWYGAGTGWNIYEPELKSRLTQLTGFDATALPSAKDIMQLAKPAYLEGKTINVEDAIPVYLRDNVAKAKNESS